MGVYQQLFKRLHEEVVQFVLPADRQNLFEHGHPGDPVQDVGFAAEFVNKSSSYNNSSTFADTEIHSRGSRSRSSSSGGFGSSIQFFPRNNPERTSLLTGITELQQVAGHPMEREFQQVVGHPTESSSDKTAAGLGSESNPKRKTPK